MRAIISAMKARITLGVMILCGSGLAFLALGYFAGWPLP